MWRAYLIETMTGAIGREVEMSTDGRYDIRLNMVEEVQATVQKSSLRGVYRKWLEPWRAGMLFTFTPRDDKGRWVGEEVPVVAGPFTDAPEEYTDSLSFHVSGIRRLFEKRLVLAKQFGVSDADVKAMKASKLTYTGAPLAFIAQDIVRRSLTREGGFLPIRFATNVPSKVANGHTRTYYGYDVNNNAIDKRLTELSEVANGPDIMFRPEWADSEHTHIRWAMVTGTHEVPTIGQKHKVFIDLTSQRNPVSEFSINARADDMVSRAYVSGAGEGAAVEIGAAETVQGYPRGIPLMEVAETRPDIKKVETLRGHARRAVNLSTVVSIAATVDGSDIRSAFGRWLVGDEMDLTCKGFFHIPDGSHRVRVVRASGGFTSSHVTLHLQEELW